MCGGGHHVAVAGIMFWACFGSLRWAQALGITSRCWSIVAWLVTKTLWPSMVRQACSPRKLQPHCGDSTFPPDPGHGPVQSAEHTLTRHGSLVGMLVGCLVGDTVGCRDGNRVGAAVGAEVVGTLVGEKVGTEVVGNLVGETVGSAVGSGVGSAVGAAVEGFVDGFQVGVGVVGAAVGPGVSNPALQLPEST